MNKIPDQVHWKLRDIPIRKLEGKVYPINTIANYLGFYDHASFTKRFREKYGMPPKVFREKYK